MPVSQYKRDECARIAKRLKKSEFANYLVQLEEEHERQLELVREEGARSAKQSLENAKLKLRCEREQLEPVRDAIRMVLRARSQDVSDKQLTLMLEAKYASKLPQELQSPSEILSEILDSCQAVIEEIGGGRGAPSYDKLQSVLDVVLADREELLKRLGMTDREWSMRGGTSYTDVEP